MIVLRFEQTAYYPALHITYIKSNKIGIEKRHFYRITHFYYLTFQIESHKYIYKIFHRIQL